MRKRIAAILAMAMIISSSPVTFNATSALAQEKTTTSADKEKEEDKDSKEENKEDNIFALKLEGDDIELPIRFEKLKELGWEIKENQRGQVIPANKYLISVILQKGEKQVYASIANDKSTKNIPVEEGLVISIRITNYINIYKDKNRIVEFETPKGINKDSTPEDLEKAYGEPTRKNKINDVVYMDFIGEDLNGIKFAYNGKEKYLDSITIKKYPTLEEIKEWVENGGMPEKEGEKNTEKKDDAEKEETKKTSNSVEEKKDTKAEEKDNKKDDDKDDDKDEDKDDDKDEDKNDDKDDNEDDDKADLGDNILDFKIKIDGKFIQFPAKLEDLKKIGYELHPDVEGSKVAKNTYLPLTPLVNTEDKDKKFDMTVTLYNKGSKEINIEDSEVAGVVITNFAFRKDKKLDFELPKGINQDSTLEEIIKAYGEPQMKSETAESASLTYEVDGDPFSKVKFSFYGKDKKLEVVELRYLKK